MTIPRIDGAVRTLLLCDPSSAERIEAVRSVFDLLGPNYQPRDPWKSLGVGDDARVYHTRVGGQLLFRVAIDTEDWYGFDLYHHDDFSLACVQNHDNVISVSLCVATISSSKLQYMKPPVIAAGDVAFNIYRVRNLEGEAVSDAMAEVSA